MNNNSIEGVLILGCGYVGEKLAKACMAQDIRVFATTRNPARAETLRRLGLEVHITDSPAGLPSTFLQSIDAIVDSIPLSCNEEGQYASQMQWLPHLAAHCHGLKWAAYLSTTGVYGDANGGWVDEKWPCNPDSGRGQQRLLAEQAWLTSTLPAEVFRLAGIYGPERNIIKRLKAGAYQAVAWNPPHFSSRIHIDDIIATLMAAMLQPRAGRLINVADDMPMPHADYVCEVATMVAADKPDILNESEGEQQLSAKLLAFFKDNKRVSNKLLHEELLPQLLYPDFRAGISNIMNIED